MLGQEIDVDAVVDRERAVTDAGYGFPAAPELLAFASAANRAANPLLASDLDEVVLNSELDTARADLTAAVGDAGVLEASATVAAFNGLVRVADGTGIELDDALVVASADVRSHLGLDAMVGSANTRRLADGAAEASSTGEPALPDAGGRVRSLFADTPAEL